MNLKKKIGILALASTLCLAVGAVCVTTQTTTASAADGEATTGVMTMAAGAAVNKTTDYGGIRWTTTVEQNFQPVSGTTAYNFGTFVIPTATYEAAKAADPGTKIEDMQGAMNIRYKYDEQTEAWTSLDTAESGFTYYSAIQYDDIVRDYNAQYPNTKTDAEIRAAAYKLELTAISYAYDGTNYHYVDVTDVSRSARQVANMAIIDGELNGLDQGVQDTINGYIVGTKNRTTAQAGYLDITELNAGTPNEVVLDSTITSADMIDEVVVGASRVVWNADFTDGATLTISSAPASIEPYLTKAEVEAAKKEKRAEEGKYTYVSVFTTDGNVYSAPYVAANGVISDITDINTKLGTRAGAYAKTGYYVLTNNITVPRYSSGGNATDYADAVEASSANISYGLNNALFDGQGYNIDGYGATYGLFEGIWNSYVRNLSLTGLELQAYNSSGAIKAASGLANSIQLSILENIYITCNTSISWTSGSSPISSSFGATRGNTMKDCVIITPNAPAASVNPAHHAYETYSFGSITSDTGNEGFAKNTFENTMVVSALPLSVKREGEKPTDKSYYASTLSEISDVYTNETITANATAVETIEYFKSGGTTSYGTHTYDDGLMMIAASKNLYSNHNAKACDLTYREYQYVAGVTRFYSTTGTSTAIKVPSMKIAYEADNEIFNNFSTDYWTVSSNGVISFKTK